MDGVNGFVGSPESGRCFQNHCTTTDSPGHRRQIQTPQLELYMSLDVEGTLHPVHYAREHNLTAEYTLFAKSQYLLDSVVKSEWKQPRVDSQLCNDLFLLPSALSYTEHIRVSRGSCELLSAITRDSRQNYVDAMAWKPDTPARDLAKLKAELPLLFTDNREDMREYEKQAARRFDILASLPPKEPVNRFSDEALEWSPEALRNVDIVVKQVTGAKLGCTRSAINYLGQVMKLDLTATTLSDARVEDLDFVSRPYPLTPPLLPRNEFNADQLSFGETLASMRPLPDDSFTLVNDLEDAAAMVQHSDAPTFAGHDHEGFDLVEQTLMDIYVPNKPTPLHERQVQVPLLPIERVRHEEDVAQMVEQQLRDHQISWPGMASNSSEDGKDLLIPTVKATDGNDNVHADFPKAFQKAAEEAQKSVFQEQLSIADTAARVSIPFVDTSLPRPAWRRLANNSLLMFRWLGTSHPAFFQPWLIDTRRELKMRWAPAELQVPQEQIVANQTHIESLINDRAELPDSSCYVSSRSFMANLDGDGDDFFELETNSHFSMPAVTASTDNECEDNQTTSQTEHSYAKLLALVKKRKADFATVSAKKIKPGETASNMFSPLLGLTSADSPTSSRLLDTFLFLRGAKNKAPITQSANNERLSGQAMATSSGLSQLPPSTDPQRENTPAKASSLYPLPDVVMPDTVTIFASSKIPETMFCLLQKSLPEHARLYERDYTLHNCVRWSPGSVSRVEAVSPLLYEADITVSASTGILMTNLTHARQCPLPRQPNQPPKLNPLKENIAKVSLRYERLMVLISEGRVDDSTSPLADSSAQALADINGFVNQLSCDISVVYVPGGNESLVKWVQSIIALSVEEDTLMTRRFLSEHESKWELFLRRAGFNVWAAQAVLGHLKSSGHHHASLSEFLNMTPDQRIATFSPILLGNRVIRRVNHTLEQMWH